MRSPRQSGIACLKALVLFFLVTAETTNGRISPQNPKAEERLGTHLIRTVASLFTLRTHHNKDKDKEKEPEIPSYQTYKPTYGAPRPTYNAPQRPSYQPTYFAPQLSHYQPRPSYAPPKQPSYQLDHLDEYGAPQAPLVSSYDSPKAVSLEYGAPEVGYTSYSPPVYKREKAHVLEESYSGNPNAGSNTDFFSSFSTNFPSGSFSSGFGDFHEFPTPRFPDISAHLNGWQEWDHYHPQPRTDSEESPVPLENHQPSLQLKSSPQLQITSALSGPSPLPVTPTSPRFTSNAVGPPPQTTPTHPTPSSQSEVGLEPDRRTARLVVSPHSLNLFSSDPWDRFHFQWEKNQ